MMEESTDSATQNNPRPVAVKRLNSIENPFLPGGDLSKETDDLLSRATVIRDQFLLKDNEGNTRLVSSSPPPEVQEGQISPVRTSGVERVKENGQSGEPASPSSVRLDTNKDNQPSRSEVPKDKKKDKKCCSIM